ncbi:MAG: alpha/beta fold hydrolase [Polyangiaceae bacterium]|nr:alpha/beta fold hydrolase [Polyangiaceae bacterium]
MSTPFSTELFRLKSQHGDTMKGVLFLPETSAPRSLGFMYVPGIVLGATAMHRLGIDVAAYLAQAGYPSCLVDPTRVGDSEGEYPAGTHRELSGWVEGGHLVDDTVRALTEFRRLSQVESVALIGHCGGALTATYALARARVEAALLLSPPTVSMGTRDEYTREMAVNQHIGLYLAKLKHIDAWRRILAGQSDYRTILKLARCRVERAARGLAGRLRTWLGNVAPGSRDAPEPSSPPRRFNPTLIEALTAAQCDGKWVRVVFGDRDPDVEDFRAFLEEHPGLSHVILPETSHGFVTEASLGLLWREIDAFVATVAGDRP